MASKKTKHQSAQPAKKKPQPRRELTKVESELKSIRSPLYKLNSRLKSAPNRYQAGKIKKEIAAYKAKTDSLISTLTDQRKDLKLQIAQRDELNREKARIRSQVYRLSKKVENAEGEQDWKKAVKHRDTIIKKKMEITKLDKAAGLRDIIKSEYEEGLFEKKGFQDDPNNPYPFWTGIKKFDEDLDSDRWSYFIVDGRRFSTKHKIEIAIAGRDLWASTDADSDTYIMRYINVKSNTVKYTLNQ